VEPEALAEWSVQARHAGTRLHGRLAVLDRDLAPLAGTWQGAAAEGFTAHHRQWQGAVAGLLGTLAELAGLIDAARANYLAAGSANTTIWRAQTPSAVVVHAMAAGDGRGRGRGRIEVDLEDIRTAVRSLVVAEDDLAAAWRALHGGLLDSGGMAGGDEAGAAFAADYDVMAAAAWQGWRHSLLMLDGIAGGLAATGNNLAAAEADSTTGPKRPFTEIDMAYFGQNWINNFTDKNLPESKRAGL